MWKKLIPIVVLVVLIAWGVTDFIQNQEQHGKASADTEQTQQRQIGIKVGNIAPDFTLPTLKGGKISLSDYRGKNVLLNFWATWCPPCRAEAPELQKFYKDHKENFVVLGVNLAYSDKKSNVKSFVKQYGMTFPIPLDKKGKVSGKYAVISYPTSYFIDENGVIRFKVRGAMTRSMMEKVVNKHMEGQNQ